jgi:hypothetical protein
LDWGGLDGHCKSCSQLSIRNLKRIALLVRSDDERCTAHDQEDEDCQEDPASYGHVLSIDALRTCLDDAADPAVWDTQTPLDIGVGGWFVIKLGDAIYCVLNG